jgi:hypothetical protein
VNGSGAIVLGAESNATFTIPAQSDQSYLVELTSSPRIALPFAALSGTVATLARHLGEVSIGLDPASSSGSVVSLRAHANNMYVCGERRRAAADRQPHRDRPREEFDLIND